MTVLLFEARRKLSWLEWELEYYRGLFPQLVRIGIKSAEDAEHELRVIEAICDDYRVLAKAVDDHGVKCNAGM